MVIWISLDPTRYI